MHCFVITSTIFDALIGSCVVSGAHNYRSYRTPQTFVLPFISGLLC